MVGFRSKLNLRIRQCARTGQIIIKISQTLAQKLNLNVTTFHLFVLVNFQLKRKFWCVLNALIEPHFDYACTSWYPMLNKRLSKKIQAAQNKCIRFYLNLKNTAHIGATEFKAINWLPTKNRIDQCVCVNVMKFFNWTAPAYSAEIFHPANQGRTTRRSKFKLEFPFRKSTSGQKKPIFPRAENME